LEIGLKKLVILDCDLLSPCAVGLKKIVILDLDSCATYFTTAGATCDNDRYVSCPFGA
jgi:hypothetical protein